MSTDSEHPAVVTGAGPWIVYRDPRVPLDFTFEYPQNWATGAERGREQPYWQVIILGPRNAANSFSAGLTVRQMPTAAKGGLYRDLDELMAARRKQYQTNPSFQLLQEGSRKLGDVAAWESDFSYVVPLPPDNVNAKATWLRTDVVQFAVRDVLYEVSYTADTADYDAYQHVFTHLLDSLRFNP